MNSELKTRTGIKTNSIQVCALGCAAGIGIFFFWISSGLYWHHEQPFVQKLMHPKAALTTACWVSAALFLVVTGIILGRTKPLIISILYATFVWILLSFLLAHATPYTTKTCFQSFAGTYGCEFEDFILKTLVMLCSLVFPTVLGLQLKNLSFRRLVRSLKYTFNE